LIESKKFVPRTFARSRHYRAILKLFDIVANSTNSDCSNFTDIINPDRCPDKYLPLLATRVGYDYDYNLSYDVNRIIIKYFPHMMRLRGSERGIKMAVALSITAYTLIDISIATSLVNITYETVGMKTVATIYMYFPKYTDKVYDLIDLIIPIGLSYKLQSSTAASHTDALLIETPAASVLSEVFADSDRFKVDSTNSVGHGEVVGRIDAYYDSSTSEFYMSYDTGVYSDIISDPSVTNLYYDLLTDTYYKYNGSAYVAYSSGL